MLAEQLNFAGRRWAGADDSDRFSGLLRPNNDDDATAMGCVLVPPPGAHTVRDSGVLALRHALRARIIPAPEATNPEPKQLSLAVLQGQLELAAISRSALDNQLFDVAPHRLSWVSLLGRVFRIDVSVRLGCEGPMRVVRAVSCPDERAEALHVARPPLVTLRRRRQSVGDR